MKCLTLSILLLQSVRLLLLYNNQEEVGGMIKKKHSQYFLCETSHDSSFESLSVSCNSVAKKVKRGRHVYWYRRSFGFSQTYDSTQGVSILFDS